MESADFCMLSHKYTAIYALHIFLVFPDPHSYLQSIPVALPGLWISSMISGGKCECSYAAFLFLFDSLYETFSQSEIFDFIQIQSLGLSERWTHAHLDEHTLQNSSPPILGIRGDLFPMYRDYALNVLYICSKIYIFACILWLREMAISRARFNSFIPEFHWGEKFPLLQSELLR